MTYGDGVGDGGSSVLRFDAVVWIRLFCGLWLVCYVMCVILLCLVMLL